MLVCVDASQFNRFHGPLPVYKRQFEGAPHIFMTKSDIYRKEIPRVETVIRSSYPLISSLIPVANGQLDLNRLSESSSKVPNGNIHLLIPGLLSGVSLQEGKRVILFSFPIKEYLIFLLMSLEK